MAYSKISNFRTPCGREWSSVQILVRSYLKIRVYLERYPSILGTTALARVPARNRSHSSDYSNEEIYKGSHYRGVGRVKGTNRGYWGTEILVTKGSHCYHFGYTSKERKYWYQNTIKAGQKRRICWARLEFQPLPETGYQSMEGVEMKYPDYISFNPFISCQCFSIGCTQSESRKRAVLRP